MAYREGLYMLCSGTDLAGESAYAVLLGPSYEFSDQHTSLSNVSSHEITDEDYERQAVTGLSVALDGNEIVFNANDVVFGAEVNIAADHFVIVAGDIANPDPGDELLFYVHLDDMESRNAQFAIRLPNGIHGITINA